MNPSGGNGVAFRLDHHSVPTIVAIAQRNPKLPPVELARMIAELFRLCRADRRNEDASDIYHRVRRRKQLAEQIQTAAEALGVAIDDSRLNIVIGKNEFPIPKG
jgi:hypothetical protein